MLCRFHHTSVHHRGFSIASGPGIVERNAQIGLDITATTAVPSWDGSPLTRFGLDVAVEGLLPHKGLLNRGPEGQAGS